MNILLINPPSLDGIVADMSDFFDESSGAYPPMGLMYLASYLAKSGRHSVRIVDANLAKMSYGDVKECVRSARPDLVGITMLTFNAPTVLRLIEDIKGVDEKILTVLGGPHPTVYPDETIEMRGVDFVVIGEGELVFAELLDALERGSGLDAVGSIGYKHNGDVIVRRDMRFIEDLDSLPFPAIDLVDHKRYFSVLSSSKRTMVMISSRGCPFKCVYCDRPHLGRRFRARTPANVVDEMEMHSMKYDVNDIKFFDDTFTVNRQRVIDICSEIRRRGLKMTWSARARVNTVDDELLGLMKEAGLTSLSFGIESGNQRVLDNLQKGITVEQVEKAVASCRRLGIEVLGDFILGNPGEKIEEMKETIRLSRRLGLDYAQFTIMTPFPSTSLYRMGLEKGIIKKDYWREFARHPTRDFVTPVWEEFYTKKELVSMLRKAYRSFYFRFGYIWKRVAGIASWAELRRKVIAFLTLLKLSVLPKRRLISNFKAESR